jgi:poly(3-hydroxybutyrate) depolymerase
MTVEGEKDDITGLGQCSAALALTPGIPDESKLHFECPKVGHYGIFNGSRFRSEIAPRMRDFMRRFDPRHQSRAVLPPIERTAAVARATGHRHDVDSAAFTFAPANDQAPDRIAESAARDGIAALSSPMAEAFPMRLGQIGLGMSAAMLRCWSLAHHLAVDNWLPGRRLK